jgi:hypothetical protein
VVVVEAKGKKRSQWKRSTGLCHITHVDAVLHDSSMALLAFCAQWCSVRRRNMSETELICGIHDCLLFAALGLVQPLCECLPLGFDSSL